MAKVEILAAGPVMHEGKPATRVTARTVPRSGSTGTRLTIRADVALDGNKGGGVDLDPEMALLSIAHGSERRELSGTVAHHTVEGRYPAEIELLIARGPMTSVLIDLKADAVEDEA